MNFHFLIFFGLLTIFKSNYAWNNVKGNGQQAQIPTPFRKTGRGQQPQTFQQQQDEASAEPAAVIPQTSFTCEGKPYQPGYYADEETECRVYHVCVEDRKESQFCAPGTVFNQKILTCDYPKDTDCAASKSYWPANEELGKPGAEPGPSQGPTSGQIPISPAQKTRQSPNKQNFGQFTPQRSIKQRNQPSPFFQQQQPQQQQFTPQQPVYQQQQQPQRPVKQKYKPSPVYQQQPQPQSQQQPQQQPQQQQFTPQKPVYQQQQPQRPVKQKYQPSPVYQQQPQPQQQPQQQQQQPVYQQQPQPQQQPQQQQQQPVYQQQPQPQQQPQQTYNPYAAEDNDGFVDEPVKKIRPTYKVVKTQQQAVNYGRRGPNRMRLSPAKSKVAQRPIQLDVAGPNPIDGNSKQNYEQSNSYFSQPQTSGSGWQPSNPIKQTGQQPQQYFPSSQQRSPNRAPQKSYRPQAFNQQQYSQQSDVPNGWRANNQPGGGYSSNDISKNNIDASIPQTNFDCEGKPYEPGMYADTEVECSIYHVCFDARKETFTCGKGTAFNQKLLTCDHIGKFKCEDTPRYYSVNENLVNDQGSWVLKPQSNQQGNSGDGWSNQRKIKK